jgi:hypothetical protein
MCSRKASRILQSYLFNQLTRGGSAFFYAFFAGGIHLLATHCKINT